MRVKFVPPKRKPKSSSKPTRSPKPKRRSPKPPKPADQSSARRASGSSARRASGSSARRAFLPAARKRKVSALLDTRVIFCGDNLQKLADFPNASVDLIYIDPPFNSNRNYEVFWGETCRQEAVTIATEALRCRSV